MQLPAVLVRVIDPANGYYDERSRRRRRGPIYREGAVFGPGMPGGSRQATDEEIEAMRRRASQRQERPRRQLTPVQRDEVAAAVHTLLQTGRATLGEGPGRCEAKIVKFWHGDSILEISHESASSLTRIPRRPSSDDQEQLFSVLAHHAAEMTT